MARTKTAKSKEMFKPYDAEGVPNTMPFPELWRVAVTKGEEAALPTLNDYQRSWILDIGVCSADLPGLSGNETKTFYERVKNDAFEAKAFQHKVQAQDCAKEARLPALVAAWKQKQKEKKDTSAAADDGDASDQEEDDRGRAALLCGHSKAGWQMAIQKVISNKQSADKRKAKQDGKAKQVDAGGSTHASASTSEGSALSKLLGLATQTGRDKFRFERREEINALAKTLTGENAGGKSRKAEALLWAKEDQASWGAAAASKEGIDWGERQMLVASGFNHMVDTLHASDNFHPFVATMLMGWLSEEGQVQYEWAEAVPDNICVDSVNAMHAWAEKPLQEYATSRQGSVKLRSPIFPLSAETLDDVTPRVLERMVTTFLTESYEAAFGPGDIPWAAISSAPDDFYDAAESPLRFTSAGLTELTRPQWDQLASELVALAGAGSSGFFRKPQRPASHPATPPPPPLRTPSLLLSRSPSPARRTPSPPTPPPPPPRTPAHSFATPAHVVAAAASREEEGEDT
ncbi:hypothetical protein B0H17DRAFT_1215106 [Mycena rosella]|uniref:Uncharacterized protein n=1 Tax=Mycena rosella TaxID=1033263 RepID=A0AAD7CLD8_MYCRO|nr:hypothetical protein B0H17DRAFT_1215106 [Mycena rosella]